MQCDDVSDLNLFASKLADSELGRSHCVLSVVLRGRSFFKRRNSAESRRETSQHQRDSTEDPPVTLSGVKTAV